MSGTYGNEKIIHGQVRWFGYGWPMSKQRLIKKYMWRKCQGKWKKEDPGKRGKTELEKKQKKTGIRWK